MKSMLVLLVLAFSTVGGSACGPGHVPPNLSPQGSLNFQRTRVIKALDLLRDTVIDGNGQTPPVFSTATTAKVVRLHQAAIQTANAADSGWVAAVRTLLDQFGKDPSLLPGEVANLVPYLTLASQALKGIQQ